MALTQDGRSLKVKTPLGDNVVLIQKLTGEEGLSRLFHFQLELLAENQTDVGFDKLLGQKITASIQIPKGERHFSGICNRIAQGGRDTKITRYLVEIVPQFWLLTRRAQCRIFQHESVPDILKKVLKGLDTTFELQGEFPKRDYCVQYRETDFAFASRLMEEEGIYYFFKHTADGHKLVLANMPSSHPDLPVEPKAIYEEVEGGNREDVRVTSWQKVQEIRSGKYTLWDRNFELPEKHLETEKTIQESVQVGKVAHKLKVGGNAELEIYEWPGGYAEYFDGIDKGGSAQPAELQKIFEENNRVVGIRMQQEALGSLEINGRGNTPQFTAGHKFTLERHFNADGQYVLTKVEHAASLPDFRSGDSGPMDYSCSFSCIPLALPFRPQRTTPKPMIHGTQNAIIVGPAGEEIFCDKYGRVKVQFYWDREGKLNADSSCWCRVNNPWGGKGWGGNFLPHVGQEVIIGFEEGDVDRPVVLGRVYNAEAMPPLELPANKTQSIIRDHGANEIKMQGEDGKQSIRMSSPHANSVFKIGATNDPFEGFFFTTDAEWNEFTKRNKKEEVTGDKEELYHRNLTQQIDGNIKMYLKGDYICQVDGWQEYSTYGHYVTKVLGFNWVTIVGADTNFYVSAQQTFNLGTHFNVYVNFRYQFEKAWAFYKSPKKKYLEAEEMKQVGTNTQKMGTDAKTVAGECTTKAKFLRDEAANASQDIKGDLEMAAKKLEAKATKLKLIGDKLEADGKKIFRKGELKVNNALKVSD